MFACLLAVFVSAALLTESSLNAFFSQCITRINVFIQATNREGRGETLHTATRYTSRTSHLLLLFINTKSNPSLNRPNPVTTRPSRQPAPKTFFQQCGEANQDAELAAI